MYLVIFVSITRSHINSYVHRMCAMQTNTRLQKKTKNIGWRGVDDGNDKQSVTNKFTLHTFHIHTTISTYTIRNAMRRETKKKGANNNKNSIHDDHRMGECEPFVCTFLVFCCGSTLLNCFFLVRSDFLWFGCCFRCGCGHVCNMRREMAMTAACV